MKVSFFSAIFLFFFITVNAQYNSSAPWMQDLQKKTAKKDHTLAEVSDAFKTYWEQHKDLKDKKGSGYKPFKRWENQWQLALDNNGKLITPAKTWNDWKTKNNLQRTTTDFSNWQNIGPYTQASKSGQGRVNTICVDPNNPNIYYVGAPAGGIWKSTNQGLTWTALSDYLPQIGVSGIVVDHTDSNTIYIATGDDESKVKFETQFLKRVVQVSP